MSAADRSVFDRLVRLPHELARLVANRAPSVQRLVNRLEVAFVRRFGRSPVSLVFATPVLVLDTTGRRSGLLRSTPVAYDYRDLDGSGRRVLVIIGGAAGQQRVPDWVANLRDDPHARVTIDGVTRSVLACEVTGSDRDVLWPQLVERWPRIADYQKHSRRVVPVFVLEEPDPGLIERPN